VSDPVLEIRLRFEVTGAIDTTLSRVTEARRAAFAAAEAEIQKRGYKIVGMEEGCGFKNELEGLTHR
jgi:hypothetical protein